MNVKFFRNANQIVELKEMKNKQHQVSVYDFQNKLVVYNQNYPAVLFMEVEDDAIYLLTEGSLPGKPGNSQK
jgi:hypothetical protein